MFSGPTNSVEPTISRTSRGSSIRRRSVRLVSDNALASSIDEDSQEFASDGALHLHVSSSSSINGHSSNRSSSTADRRESLLLAAAREQYDRNQADTRRLSIRYSANSTSSRVESEMLRNACVSELVIDDDDDDDDGAVASPASSSSRKTSTPSASKADTISSKRVSMTTDSSIRKRPVADSQGHRLKNRYSSTSGSSDSASARYAMNEGSRNRGDDDEVAEYDFLADKTTFERSPGVEHRKSSPSNEFAEFSGIDRIPEVPTVQSSPEPSNRSNLGPRSSFGRGLHTLDGENALELQNLAFGMMRDILSTRYQSKYPNMSVAEREHRICQRLQLKIETFLRELDTQGTSSLMDANSLDIDGRLARDASPMQTPSSRWLADSWRLFRIYAGAPRLVDKLSIFPHMPLVLNALSTRHAASSELEDAVKCANAALDQMLIMAHHRILYSAADEAPLLNQWHLLKQCLLKCPSLSRSGKIQYMENKAAALFTRWVSMEQAYQEELARLERRQGSADGNVDCSIDSNHSNSALTSNTKETIKSAAVNAGNVQDQQSLSPSLPVHPPAPPSPAGELDRGTLERLLFKRVQSDVQVLHDSRLEKYGNVILIYLGIFFILFLVLRCYVESSCAATVPQLVQVSSHSYISDPPFFAKISIYPRCASLCPNSTECTCPSSALSCPLPPGVTSADQLGDALDGTWCTCNRALECDSCSMCGKTLSFLRHYALLMFFGTTLLDLLLMLVGLFAVQYPAPTLDGNAQVDEKFFDQRAMDVRDVAVLIAHYGCTGPIEATLKAALEIFEPGHIFLCHNGPSDAPIDPGVGSNGPGDSLRTVREVSQWYREQTGRADVPDINYCWTTAGNKSLALFQVARFACRYSRVLIMDNDCQLPKDIRIPVHWFREDGTQAIAFTIRAQNTRKADASINMITTFQDIEYKKAGLIKLLQAKFGSCLFAHGAVSMWNRHTMIRVFRKHNTMFHGEDLQMGLLLHKENKGESIKACGNISVPTRTPAHFWCFPVNTRKALASGKPWILRCLLAPYKCNAWDCPHEEKSLFVQRVRSWDACSYRFLGMFVDLLLFYWKRSILGLKPFILYELWCIVQDVVRIPLAFFLLWQDDSQRSNFLLLLVLLFVARTLLLLMMELWTFRKRADLQSRLVYAILFPWYNLLLLLVRFMGLLFNLLVYLPGTRNAAKIKNRARLPNVYYGKFISLELNVEPPAPRPEDLPDSLQESRVFFAVGRRLPASAAKMTTADNFSVQECSLGNRTFAQDRFDELDEDDSKLRGCMRIDGGWRVLEWNVELRKWMFVKEIMDADPLNLPRRPVSAGSRDLDMFHVLLLGVLLFAGCMAGLYTKASFSMTISASSTSTMIGWFLLVFHAILETASIVWGEA
eukprot:ANDGO_07653.mRNA.1 hypothetical protein Pmar_PMAR023743